MDANAFWDLIQECLNLGSTLQIQALSPEIKAGVHFIFTALKPAASMLLSLFAMLEIYRIYTKTELISMPQPLGMLYIVASTLFKISIAVFLIRYMEDILWAINDLANSIMTTVQGIKIGEAGMPGGITKEQVDEFFKEADGNIISNVLFTFELLIVRLALKIVVLFINIFLWSRSIEIYLLAALCAFPMVTFVSEEHSQVGKSFIKHFAAVCLRGVVMMVIVKIYNVLVYTIELDSTDLLGLGLSLIQCLAVLCVSLAISNRLAKVLTGAM